MIDGEACSWRRPGSYRPPYSPLLSTPYTRGSTPGPASGSSSEWSGKAWLAREPLRGRDDERGRRGRRGADCDGTSVFGVALFAPVTPLRVLGSGNRLCGEETDHLHEVVERYRFLQNALKSGLEHVHVDGACRSNRTALGRGDERGATLQRTPEGAALVRDGAPNSDPKRVAAGRVSRTSQR